jgi:RimJ/RimL family protein N-acetyltransferase
MDHRLRRYLESQAGVSLETLPARRVAVCESPARTDEAGNRVNIQRFPGLDSLLATVLSGHAGPVERVLAGLSPGELFCPLGAAELCRAIGADFEPNPYYTYGLDYTFADPGDFRPASARPPVRVLYKDDIPAKQLALRMGERRASEIDNFVWAFAGDLDDPAYQAGAELSPFGAQCAAIAVVIWAPGPVATYGVGTDSRCRGRGYALAATSAATAWILEQGETPVYGAYANNVPSLRIARRLGFRLLQQSMSV